MRETGLFADDAVHTLAVGALILQPQPAPQVRAGAPTGTVRPALLQRGVSQSPLSWHPRRTRPTARAQRPHSGRDQIRSFAHTHFHHPSRPQSTPPKVSRTLKITFEHQVLIEISAGVVHANLANC